MGDWNKKLEACRDLLRIQGSVGNWDYDEYMHGMFNGMELILAMMEDRGPEYRQAPDRFRRYIHNHAKCNESIDSSEL